MADISPTSSLSRRMALKAENDLGAACPADIGALETARCRPAGVGAEICHAVGWVLLCVSLASTVGLVVRDATGPERGTGSGFCTAGYAKRCLDNCECAYCESEQQSYCLFVSDAEYCNGTLTTKRHNEACVSKWLWLRIFAGCALASLAGMILAWVATYSLERLAKSQLLVPERV